MSNLLCLLKSKFWSSLPNNSTCSFPHLNTGQFHICKCSHQNLRVILSFYLIFFNHSANPFLASWKYVWNSSSFHHLHCNHTQANHTILPLHYHEGLFIALTHLFIYPQHSCQSDFVKFQVRSLSSAQIVLISSYLIQNNHSMASEEFIRLGLLCRTPPSNPTAGDLFDSKSHPIVILAPHLHFSSFFSLFLLFSS